MPKPRCNQVSLEATSYYHCVSRCVRRAFLCGIDDFTGKNYEYRRQLLENKILELGNIFAIDVCAYAVMSNHYHLVLHINKEQAENWTIDEVIQQWHKLFSGTLFSRCYIKKDKLLDAEYDLLIKDVEKWRVQLMDISWFMRVLNETTARSSNKEDKCTGRFWEGRFKSQALLDEPALAACMAYVDLNPIRSKLANSPEDSMHTSIKLRIDSLNQRGNSHSNKQPNNLYPFVGNPRQNIPAGLPFCLEDYLELVDITGRIMREDKRGFISNKTPPILKRLNIAADNWIYLSRHFESKLKGLVGTAFHLKEAYKVFGYKRNCYLSNCERYFT